MIKGQRGVEPTATHDDKGDTVHHSPIFVLILFIEFEPLPKEVRAEMDQLRFLSLQESLDDSNCLTLMFAS